MYIVSHRSRAIAAAIFIVPLMLWMTCTLDGGKLQSAEPIQAVMHTLAKTGKTDSGEIYAAQLKLPDGQQISLTLHTPVPKPGESVPLIRRTFKNQQQEYRFDRETWQRGK
ncbi:MAG: hypothetical protein CVV27_15570 [Candidatus Melainabacteria bacterium HGW-Melainabacteria-1]|nr:MAG: hypothetical protein CVV27_15570 [Candidatus Melainabacteria bacterium HGW-Melainabacteria-1]